MEIENFARPLNEKDLIKDFLSVVLRINKVSDTLVNKIRLSEIDLISFGKQPSTLTSQINWHLSYKNKVAKRWELRKRIVKELFTMQRQENDDKIKLGNGGARSRTIQKNGQAYIVIGLPASGKSGIANIIANKTGSIILDSDFAKRKLPEYKTTPAGASLVHTESDYLIYGINNDVKDRPDDFISLSELCTNEKINIVIPKIGQDHQKILTLAKFYKDLFGYEVHLVSICLDRMEATRRAVNRFKKSSRYVPLSLIFDGFSNEPLLNYYRLKNFYPNEFNSFGKISTINQTSEVMESSSSSLVKMFK